MEVEAEKPKASSSGEKPVKHMPWIEKYRPTEFSQIVGKISPFFASFPTLFPLLFKFFPSCFPHLSLLLPLFPFLTFLL